MDADGNCLGGSTKAAARKPSDRLNLDDHIYRRVKMMIAKGELLPGERIVPEQLAATMGVSRTPIIAALKRLSQEQLLEWRSRRGVHVRRLTPRELVLIFEVREVLEGLAARRAAQFITPQQIDRLRGLFTDIDRTESPANRHHYLRQDYRFHMGLFRIADNPLLFRTMESVNIMVMAFTGGLLRPMREVLAEHETILQALAQRDAVAAEAAARVHIHRSVVWLRHQANAFETAQRDLHRQPLEEAFSP